MSSKKITDADKLEIVDLYRQSGDTTASLANRYGVSNSTISRLLKTSIPESEYEVLIQQKRGSKSNGEEEILTTALDEPNFHIPVEITPKPDINNLEATQQPKSFLSEESESVMPSAPADAIATDGSPNSRRVRRRSSAPISTDVESIAESSHLVTIGDVEESVARDPALSDIAPLSTAEKIDLFVTEPPAKSPVPPPIPRTPVLQKILTDSYDRYSNPPVADAVDDLEDDAETEDVNALAAMFGEEIADSEDDDDPDSEDWDESTSADDLLLDREQLLTTDNLDIRVMPLSQATLPRTCYIAIDKFAELVVRPLKDFADLGQVSAEEIHHRILPVFDNHRVAKRFSNQRTQRVIKVPDSRIFYKTTQHLRSKGITCLLVDGNIYSLN